MKKNILLIKQTLKNIMFMYIIVNIAKSWFVQSFKRY